MLHVLSFAVQLLVFALNYTNYSNPDMHWTFYF